MKSSRWCLIAAALTCATAPARAAEWDNTLLIYLLGAGLEGKTQVGSVSVDIDQSFSHLLEHLDVGGMGSYRVSNETWAHTVDFIFTSLSDDEAIASGQRVGAQIDQLIASYDLGYRIGQRVEVLAGARYNSIDADLVVGTATGPLRASGDKEWVDPYVGARAFIPFNDTFGLALRGDIGGFGVGSDLAWQAIAWLTWNMTDTFFGTVGYRYLDTDYESGSGERFFKYDVAIHGPTLGFGWTF